MRRYFPILAAVAMSLGIVATSCGRNDKFVGTWTALSQSDITSELPAASSATSLMTIQFMPGTDGRGGSVAISSLVDITQPVDPAAGAFDQPYEVSVAATTSIGGTWMYEGDDDDELLLSLDLSSLNVTVDKNGVTFTQNLLTGKQQPELDSLTATTANLWRQQLSAAMRRELARFNRLDDVEVNRDGILSFEIKNPDAKLFFRKS